LSAGATLITGANRGIGRALAAQALARGLSVIGTHRGPMPDLPAIGWQHLDIADPASTPAPAERLADQTLSLLVCNAGIYPEDPENPDHWRAGR
jgi:NAD(P)-dependent dehydrogenase (short-subunit alcohol dehydrogenase family)